MEITLFIFGWYLIGLLGSHIAIMSSKYFSWDNSLGFGLGTALAGPINLLACIFFALIIAGDE